MLTDVFGVRVQFVMGMTDIDDKIIARANECGVEPGVLAARFEGRFVEDMRMLGVRPPEATLRVSEHVDEIIAYIDGIMARGMAYESHQGVQFDTRAFGDSYGACFGTQSHVDAGAPEGASGSSSVDDDTGGSSAKGGKRDARDFVTAGTAAGGVATPADVALLMELGVDGVFVGSGIFKSHNPEARARAIVRAVTHFNDPKILMEVSTGLGPAMVGICDIKADPVNFRDREGGEVTYSGKVPPKRDLHGATETQLYGSSWESTRP